MFLIQFIKELDSKFFIKTILLFLIDIYNFDN